MAKTRPSVQKRRMEARKLEKAQIKAARKAARLAAKDEEEDHTGAGDPDLAGIVAGPQPVKEDPLEVEDAIPEY